MNRQMLILGAGFSGVEIGRLATERGFDVTGTSRTEERFDRLRSAGIGPLVFDGKTNDEAVQTALGKATHLVVSIAPPREENTKQPDAIVDPVLAALADHALTDIAPNLQWIGYLSTVGVYGNHDGEWVDEQTTPRPVSARSRQRVRAEAEWMTAAEHAGLALAIFRLSGIYGPGRNALRTAQQGKSRRLVKPGQVFNRIHVFDIATAVCTAAEGKITGLFNITDDEPSPPQDVVTYAHELLGIDPPPEVDFETADLSPMARSFYGENKRVSNARSKAVLGIEYSWPNYRESLSRMFETGKF